MSEASYTAWDDNLYEWPPPEGWYQGSDGRWWPAGYGPAAEGLEPSTEAPSAVSATALDMERTSAFPAGGFVVNESSSAGPGTPPSTAAAERLQAEARRRIFDEPPPIDDVFGGVDPYAATETPEASDAGSTSVAAAEDVDDPGTDSADSHLSDSDLSDSDLSDSDLSDSDLSDSDRADGDEPEGWETDWDDTIADHGDSAGGNGSAPTASPVVSPLDVPTGPVAGGPWSTNGSGTHPDLARSDVARSDEAPFDAGATRLAGDDGPQDPGSAGSEALASERRATWSSGPVLGADDGATAPIDLAALLRSGEGPPAAGGPPMPAPGAGPGLSPGAGFDPDATVVTALPGEGNMYPDEPPFAGSGYGGIPLDGSPTARRWWPMVVIGLALVAVVASTVAYLVLRDGGTGDAAAGDDPNRPGSFTDPYDLGVGVVVFYDDEASNAERRWVLQVLAPVADAAEQLDGQVAPPADGDVLALTRVRVIYQSGPEPGSLADLRLNAVGDAQVTFDQATNACGALPDPLDAAATLDELGSVEGDICWRVPADQLANLKLAIGAGPAAGTVHLSLH